MIGKYQRYKVKHCKALISGRGVWAQLDGAWHQVTSLKTLEECVIAGNPLHIGATAP